MIKTLEKSARTEDEAIALALSELGLDRDEVSVEILGAGQVRLSGHRRGSRGDPGQL